MAPSPLDALRDAALAREPDRYFAATLAPEAIRYDLIVLAAFATELDNIPMQVREPLAGEIRLQWWRDALAAEGEAAAAGHPVAMAMRATIARHGLPAEIVSGIIDSFADRLYGERPADENALSAQMAAGEGGLFRLGAHIAGAEDVGDIVHITRTAGLAYGLARALLRLPVQGIADLQIPRILLSDEELARAGADSANGPLPAPIVVLGDLARAAMSGLAPRLAKMSRAKRLPFLPLAMVRPNLRALEAWSRRRGTSSIEAMPISRLLRITWAHASGRL